MISSKTNKTKKYDEALKYGHEIEKKIEYDLDIALIIGFTYIRKIKSKQMVLCWISKKYLRMHYN